MNLIDRQPDRTDPLEKPRLDLLAVALDVMGEDRVPRVACRALEALRRQLPAADWAIVREVESDRFEVFARGEVEHTELRQLVAARGAGNPWLAVHDPVLTSSTDLDLRPIRRRVDAFSLSAGRRLLLACWTDAAGQAGPSEPELERAAGLIHSAVQSASVIECLIEQSARDSLTGLYNRRAILEALERERARARRQAVPVSVLFIDIDRFKAINDRFGHTAGDEVLTAISTKIHDCIRSSDAVGRLGGDEFVIILYDTDLQTAGRVGRRLEKAVAQMDIWTPYGALRVSITAGAAASDETTGDHALVERADLRMLRAKAYVSDAPRRFEPAADRSQVEESP